MDMLVGHVNESMTYYVTSVLILNLPRSSEHAYIFLQHCEYAIRIKRKSKSWFRRLSNAVLPANKYDSKKIKRAGTGQCRPTLFEVCNS
jgi:hypothetical protein